MRLGNELVAVYLSKDEDIPELIEELERVLDCFDSPRDSYMSYFSLTTLLVKLKESIN